MTEILPFLDYQLLHSLFISFVKLYPASSVLILPEEEANQNRFLNLEMIEDARVWLDQDEFSQNRLTILKKRLLK